MAFQGEPIVFVILEFGFRLGQYLECRLSNLKNDRIGQIFFLYQSIPRNYYHYISGTLL